MADFSQMKVLDADSKKLSNSVGKEAKRDIVQFVSLRDFSKPLYSNTGQVVGFQETRFQDLSNQVLRELPNQFLSPSFFFLFLFFGKTENIKRFRTGARNKTFQKSGSFKCRKGFPNTRKRCYERRNGITIEGYGGASCNALCRASITPGLGKRIR